MNGNTNILTLIFFRAVLNILTKKLYNL